MPSSLAKPPALCAAITIALASTAVVPSCIQRPAVPAEPETSNQFVEQIRYQSVDKIDLLFVVDNSVSMNDKQDALKEAVPGMLRRLVNPPCVDDAGQRMPAQEGADVPCLAGFEREFQPVEDIHIGVISSSLGPHGGELCANSDGSRPQDNDRAHLIPKVRAGLTSWNDTGFLLWDPRGKYGAPTPATSVADDLISAFEQIIDKVDDNGCGYESTLEAWYRFLVDPEPPMGVQIGEGGRGVPTGVDQDVLAQRKTFLRPDSLVVIVTLTDEDDCSIRDDEYGWMASAESVDRPRGTSACATDPLSQCCRPCTAIESQPPEGCMPIASDPACANPTYPRAPGSDKRPGDDANLRCFDQKRRYGMDFLYPTSRYVRALTEPEIPNRAGTPVPNPLFEDAVTGFVRDKSMILYAGIVGVPWQDAATTASIDGPGLRYMNAKELALEGRFELFLGDPQNPDPAKRAPLDPLMVASPNPRSGTHPLTGEPVAPPTSSNPQENRINGHESVNVGDSDLQYACIFPIEPDPSCTTVGCDCHKDDLDRNRPLCQPPTGGEATTTQYYAKAYPGLRHLEVLKGIGDAAVVASICPKVTAPPLDDPSYGYNPALEALTDIIIDRFELCLPRALDVSPTGELPCRVAEALPSTSCDCSALPGRTAPSGVIEKAVRDELEKSGHCGGDTGRACKDYCVCALSQAADASLASCQNDKVADGAVPGYCYIDGERKDETGQPAPIGNRELVANCPAGSQRKLRFVGRDTPQNGAITFIACMGAAL